MAEPATTPDLTARGDGALLVERGELRRSKRCADLLKGGQRVAGRVQGFARTPQELARDGAVFVSLGDGGEVGDAPAFVQKLVKYATRQVIFMPSGIMADQAVGDEVLGALYLNIENLILARWLNAQYSVQNEA